MLKNKMLLLFIANIISVIFLIYLSFTKPSITGLVVNNNLGITSPPNLAILFVVTTFVLDIYFYMKGRREAR